MTLTEIKTAVMYQTNNDAADLGDFEPYITDYINEGYDRLVWAHEKKHVEAGGTHPPLSSGTDTPNLPKWTHGGIVNWATWCVYRGGNAARQNRGYAFRQAAEEIIAKIRESVDVKFVNVPL